MTFKVAIVIGQLGYGGAERQACILAKGLSKSGWPVIVVSLSVILEPFGEELEKAGVGLRCIPRGGHYEFKRILRLASIIREEPTVAHQSRKYGLVPLVMIPAATGWYGNAFSATSGSLLSCIILAPMKKSSTPPTIPIPALTQSFVNT